MSKQNQTFSLFFALGRVIRSRIEHDSNLSLPQLETLRFVFEHEKPTMLELAHHHHITAPSATSLCDELVRMGYLVRSRGAQDRRQVRLSLTPAGMRALKGNMERRKQIVEDLLATLAPKDRQELDRILARILAAYSV